MSRRRRRRAGSMLVGTVLAGCGPGAAPGPAPPPDPPAPPVVAPGPTADAGAPPPPPAPPSLELAVAPAPEAGDPPGKDPEARWRWAVQRLPELATLYRTTPANLAGRVGRNRRVVLHSPNLDESRTDGLAGYKRCDPLEFVLRKGVLVTRLPADGSRARPEVAADYVELTLGAHVDHRDALRRDFTVTALCGGGGGGGPVVSDSTRDLLRYGGAPAEYVVPCRTVQTKRPCTDGSSHTCEVCEPSLGELVSRPNQGGGSVGRHRVNVGRVAGVTCEPCPPDPGRQVKAQLEAVVGAHTFVHRFEDGEEFYRDREACLAAAALPPPAEPLADDHVHGFPLHPTLVHVCSRRAATPVAGGGYLEVNWSLYASRLVPDALAAWYASRLGDRLVAAADAWTATLPAPHGPQAELMLAAAGGAAPSCGPDVPAGARTLLRVSTAVRR